MAIRPILRFPDPKLRLRAAPVDAFNPDLHELAADLLETLRAVNGVGITAPHIGIGLRVVVLDGVGAAGVRTYVNPEIAWTGPETIRHEEGSISMPGVSDEVERPSRIRLGFRDLDGGEHEEEADGFLAVCLQHEIDQLDGIFWIQRLSRLKRDRLVKRYEKLARGRAE